MSEPEGISKAWEQLMLLRTVSDHAGGIHEAQVMQLKLWGRLVFDGATDVEIGVNLEKGEREVRYLATYPKAKPAKKVKGKAAKKPKAPKVNPRALEALERSVKALLGEDFKVTATANGVTIFGVVAK